MSYDPTPIDQFVRAAITKGEDRAAIRAALEQAGWPSAEVSNALGGYADIAFPVPVPLPHASLSARELFLYLVFFTALYISVWNFGELLFEFIDRAFPDVTQGRYGGGFSLEDVRWNVSSLIVAFPVLLWTGHHIGKRLALNPAGRLSPVRRYCTYITLFIAVAVLIGDATTLIYNLLGGELTVRFLLKALVVAGIAGSALFHFLRDLRHEERASA
ncbi:MAG TPA: DUF5671 domain-containing protein [Gemmatimonadaceae bacterium]